MFSLISPLCQQRYNNECCVYFTAKLWPKSFPFFKSLSRYSRSRQERKLIGVVVYLFGKDKTRFLDPCIVSLIIFLKEPFQDRKVQDAF